MTGRHFRNVWNVGRSGARSHRWTESGNIAKLAERSERAEVCEPRFERQGPGESVAPPPPFRLVIERERLATLRQM